MKEKKIYFDGKGNGIPDDLPDGVFSVNGKEVPDHLYFDGRGRIIEDGHLHTYEAVRRFKSIKRAQRKGYVTEFGFIAPRRPFNNRKNKPKQDIKRRIYEELRRYTNRTQV